MNDLKEYISFKKLYIHSIWRKVSSCKVVVNINIGVYYHVMPNRVVETLKNYLKVIHSVHFLYQRTPFITPTKCTFLISTNIK